MIETMVELMQMAAREARRQEMQKKYVILTEVQTILGRTDTLEQALNWARVSAKTSGCRFQIAEVVCVVKPGEAIVDEA